MAIMTPKQVALSVRVRPGPNGGHHYNGLLDLEDAARRIEPALARLDVQAKAAFLKLLRKELGLEPTRKYDAVYFIA
jgi:hypothetical protein